MGTLRPAIVLYDEPHPLGDDIGAMQTADMKRKPDMLIIMGTSLKVHGFKKLVRDFAKIVKESAPSATSSSSSPSKKWAGRVIFVNKTAPGSEWDGIIDYHVAGETDKWVERVKADWQQMKRSDWETQQTLSFATVKKTATAATKSKGDEFSSSASRWVLTKSGFRWQASARRRECLGRRHTRTVYVWQ